MAVTLLSLMLQEAVIFLFSKYTIIIDMLACC